MQKSFVTAVYFGQNKYKLCLLCIPEMSSPYVFFIIKHIYFPNIGSVPHTILLYSQTNPEYKIWLYSQENNLKDFTPLSQNYLDCLRQIQDSKTD